jgi:hypothetical protein
LYRTAKTTTGGRGDQRTAREEALASNRNIDDGHGRFQQRGESEL